MSGLFDDDPTPPRRVAPAPRPQRSRALLGTAAVLVASFFVLSAFTGVWTDRLWFNSVGYGEVFTTVLGTRALLFVGFGLLMGGFVAANVLIAFRSRPDFTMLPPEPGLERYRDAVEPMRKWVVIALAVVLGLIAGGSASGQWRSFLLWRHAQPSGRTDPYFDRDISFFLMSLPWLHYVVNFVLMTVVLGLIAALIVHYLFGGIRLQARTNRVSGPAQVQFSVLLGLFVLVKAVDYYLDRFDLTTDQGRRFTGINYTAFNAVLPSKTILMWIAVICALLFFANVFFRTWLLPTIGLGLLVLSAILLGAVWPGIVYQFQVKPSEPNKEEEFLARNIVATRDAFGIAGVTEQPYDAKVTVSPGELQESAASLPGIRLIDPARMSRAFNQLQQVRGYYSVAPVLDVDRYPIGGQTRDVVLGVRELDQAGLVTDQRNWSNERTVYTHGYGVIAAYGNNRTADNQAPPGDEPPWAEEDLPPKGDLSELSGPEGYEGRIYFGEKSPEYSIVGKVEGGVDQELDIPEESTGERGTTTYDGADGVSVGGLFNRLLYGIKFGEPNIVLSSLVNENSKILYERNPRERVEKVAPWLTVDGDPYPAVVGGRVVWILDGYTMSDRYPNAERTSFREMTNDSLSPTTAYVTLPTDQVNYMRNSVKAVVDAYDGTVDLYAWDETDPLLAAWREAFPDLVQPRDAIPPELQAHMRYPEDLFKVQRYMLARYHVTDALTLYRGTDQWKVPEDPSQEGFFQPPYRLSVQMPPPPEPAEDGQAAGDESAGAATDASVDTADEPLSEEPVFSLTSVFVPTGRDNLVSFIAVNSDATSEDYGQFQILRLPDGTQIQGPSQIANTFAADEDITDALTPIRVNSTVLYGNLLTLPVGGGLLYVQPVYALQTSGQGSYPVLRFVLASFGRNAGYGTSLDAALRDVLGTDTVVDPPIPPGPDGGGGPGGGQEDPGAAQGRVLTLLRQADAKFQAADQALRDGDPVQFQRLTAQGTALFEEALRLAERRRN